jgi:hypothetical protein
VIGWVASLQEAVVEQVHADAAVEAGSDQAAAHHAAFSISPELPLEPVECGLQEIIPPSYIAPGLGGYGPAGDLIECGILQDYIGTLLLVQLLQPVHVESGGGSSAPRLPPARPQL